MELLEAFTGWESCNKYKIMNNLGQDVFFAKEDTDCCTRMCCGPGRPFEMNIVDNSGKEVIHLVRPLRCQGCCFPCCLQELEVHSPAGTIIGSVEQKWTLCTPLFAIKNERGEEILTIEGPLCGFECCSDIDFNITSAGDGSEVGDQDNSYLYITHTISHRLAKSQNSGQVLERKCSLILITSV